jgi:surfactin synthase thioesterase subunit/short-subunit dehydrogenase/acyl carrier protein
VVTVDIAIYRDDLSPVGVIEGLSLKLVPPQVLAPHTAANADWLYAVRWDERPPLGRSTEPNKEPSPWLILADRSGVAGKVAEALGHLGTECRLVHLDDAIERAGGLHDHDDLTRHCSALLSDALQDATLRFGHVLNLWPLDVSTEGATVGDLEQAQAIIFAGHASLFRTFAESSRDCRIWLVTRQAVAARPDDPPAQAASAAVWGMGRSASLEHPQIWGGLLDLGSTGSAAEDADSIVGEVLHGDGEDQIALRSGQRLGARLVRAQATPAPKTAFDAEGSYLITGGLGALGVELGKWLVTRRGVKHLVLMSRRGEKDAKAGAVRTTFAALGADVAIVQADVTEERDIKRALKQIDRSGHPLKGVFHCAGLLDDGILTRMDWHKFRRVLAPKVLGGWLLHQLTRKLEIDHFVLFSSILSLTGSAGQTNYAAANAFLDALAARRRSEGLPALALNFGPWEESGLATESGEKGRAIWRARGTEYIRSETGWLAFDALIGSGQTHGAITLTHWPTFLAQFAGVPRLYDELKKEAAARPLPAADADGTIKASLEEASGAERRGLLTSFIQRQAMKTLGISGSIDPDQPLRELGLDSLMSVTLVNRLEAALGVRMSAVKVIQGPSVAQLAEDILSELPAPSETRAGVAEGRSEPVAGARVDRAGAPRAGSWLVVVGPRTAPRCRLFCFPFAGGGSATSRNWAESLDPGIEVVAVEPPGRLSRVNEEPVTSMGEFVSQLTSEMQGMLDRPFAFFGHCLGGLTMYETARRLINTTAAQPIHLFASGSRPPDRIADLGSFEEQLTEDLMNLDAFRVQLPPYAQPDDVFAELIRHFQIAATEQLLEDPKLRQIMLPVIRAEFQLANDYQFVAESPWDVPITCFGTRDDPYVSRRHAFGWGRFTNTRFQVFIRDGVHFSVVDDSSFILSVISRELQF